MPDSETDATIAAARQRRQDYLDRIHPWTRSNIPEHQREAADEYIDNQEIEEQYSHHE